jgi:hypothetical protein
LEILPSNEEVRYNMHTGVLIGHVGIGTTALMRLF